MSNVYQKSEFYDAATSELSSGNYPALSARLALGDVTFTQQLGAMAQMLAMLSYQLGLAEVEPWVKARDNMVLADAAMRGVLPYGKAAIYRANIINKGVYTHNITAGRRLLDNKGRIWTIANGTTIASGETQSVQIEQYELSEKIHTVSEKKSFYTIPIPQPETDSYLLDVAVKHSDGGYFQFAEKFNNVSANTRAYHLVCDEMMNVMVQFGLENKAGYIPEKGEEITLILRYTNGNATLNNATALEFEYMQTHEEDLTILSADLVQAGTAPFSIDELREITNYPSLYDNNAVFLGEFQFLLQRKLSPFVFLNVWNERKEEAVRGANLDNVNTLFVSFLKDGIDVEEAKKQITHIIQAADNSYRLKFIDAIEEKININITLSLAPMHDEAAVKQKIIVYLVAQYGKNSAWARKGGQRINWQNTVKSLRENITELQDGVSDIDIESVQSSNLLPETFRYVSSDSVKIVATKLYS